MNLVERTWYGTEPTPGAWLGPLLRGASAGFGLLARARGFVYDQGYLRAERVGARVISVGNLTVGGAGKTPVTLLLCQRLLARGKRVAVVSRGYGGTDRRALVAAEGRVLRHAGQAGDEPVLLGLRAPGAVVLVGADRVALARRAIAEHRAEVILLDDGFQHRRLARDEDILVLGGERPLGNGALLPAGPLREPQQAASRATVAWLSNGAALAERLPLLPRRRVVSRHAPTCLTDLTLSSVHDLGALAGKRVFLLAGLARPGGFLQTAQALGARRVGQAFFGDHHRYRPRDLEQIQARAEAAGAELILTTEKDAVRLQRAPRLKMELAVLRIDVELLQGAEVVEELCAC